MSESRTIRSRPASVIEVTGEDAAEFLQSQFSNDLRGPGNHCVYGLWLDFRGRIQADSFVLCHDPEFFLLVSYGSEANVIIDHLAHHLVADEVELADRTEAHFLETRLNLSRDTIELSQNQFDRSEGAIRFWGRRSSEPDLEILKTGVGTDSRSLPSTVEITEFTQLRWKAGLPLIPVDVGSSETPNDVQLTDAVSLQKGCFLGQEVVARMDRLDRSRRKLIRVKGSGKVPAFPISVHQDGSTIGEVRSGFQSGEQFCATGVFKSSAIDRSLADWQLPDGTALTVMGEGN